MRLDIVVPLIGTTLNDHVLQEAHQFAGPQTEIVVANIDHGPASIESVYDEVLAGPGIVAAVAQAAEDGADAVFVTCFGDPAVHAAREVVDIPVCGGFEPAVLAARAMAERFSIVTVLPNVVPMIERLARVLGVDAALASVRVIDMPVLELEGNVELEAMLLDSMREAIRDDAAHALVLGCTGMLGVAASLQRSLEQEGPYVPVIDPTAAAILWLESQVRMGIRPSRRTYMPPPAKLRTFAGNA